MKLMNSLGKALAVLAVSGLAIAPIASAEPDRGHGHGGGGGHGGYDRGHGGGGGHDYRGGGGGHDYRGGGGHDGYRGNDRRYGGHDYRRPAPPPRYSYRPVPHRYYAPPPRYSGYVTYGYVTGPYFRTGYISPYRVGGYYRPVPTTVYIRDYAHYGLYAPPPGYYWVRDYDRGDAILASMATGAIIGLVVGAIAAN